MEIEIGQFSVEIMYPLLGIKDKDVFITYIKGKGLKTLDFSTRKAQALPLDKNGEITQIKATPDAKFVFLGISSASSIGVFSLDHATLSFKLLKWISIDFVTFEMDDYCSYIIFMNHKSRILEFYGVKWQFDKSNLNMEEYNQLNDAMIE